MYWLGPHKGIALSGRLIRNSVDYGTHSILKFVKLNVQKQRSAWNDWDV